MSVDTEGAVRNAYAWFETNSGSAPPNPDTLAEWLANGVCRCPHDCLVVPAGWCQHDLASWLLILADVDGDSTSAGSGWGWPYRTRAGSARVGPTSC